MTMMIDLILSLLVAAMLATSFILYRKMDILKSAQGDMKSLIAELTAVCDNAQSAIVHLKTAYKETGDSLNDKIRQGQRLADELSIMMESGERMASDVVAKRPERRNPLNQDKLRQAAKSQVPSEDDTRALAKLLQGLR